MSPALLTAERVRELTAAYRPAPTKPPRKRRTRKLNPENIAKAERMLYVEGKSFKEVALAIGCSLSRIYGVLAGRRHAAGSRIAAAMAKGKERAA